MRVLNIRLLAVLLACVVFFGGIVYFVHSLQVPRIAHIFLREADKAEKRAEQAEEEGNAGQASRERLNAARNLALYVKLVPKNVDALEKLGMLLSELRHYGQAFDVLERVVRRDPARKQTRRELVDIAIAMRRFPDARAHLEKYLLADSPNDAELLGLLGRCQAAMTENAEALESFRKAIELAPQQIEVYPRLADILRTRFKRDRQAERVMAKMIEANPDSQRGHLLYGRYLHGIGAAEGAMRSAQKALDLRPDDRDALWLSAQCALETQDLTRARQLAQRGIELYPTDVPMYITLSDVELRAARRDAAVETVQKGLDAAGDDRRLLWRKANLLIEAGRIAEAEQTTGKLAASDCPEPMLDYLRARLDFVQARWLSASRKFEHARPGLAGSPGLLKQIDFWLGECYGKLGNTDRQISAYRRAVVLDHFFAPARTGIAEALLRAGRVDEAMIEYRQLMKLGTAAKVGVIPWARMLVLRTLRQEPSQRRWGPVEHTLDEVERLLPDSIEVSILRAQVLVAQGLTEEAEKLLTEERDKRPEEVLPWTVLAALAQRQGDWSGAEQVLDQARQRLGARAELLIARANYLAQRHGKAAVEQLRELADETRGLSDARRVQLWKGLLRTALQLSDDEQVERLCRRISQAEPNNVQVQFLLFELALRAGDAAAMDQALEKIRQIEQGPLWLYARAVRLSWQGKKGDKQLLRDALALLEQARQLRPSWPRIPLLAGGIHDQLGQAEEALESYLLAIDLGERNPVAIRRAIQLLYLQNRFIEARKLLGRFEEIPPELLGMARTVDLRLGNLQQALDSARKAAEDSDDCMDSIWLGQILAMMGQRAKADQRLRESQEMLREARQALQRATELDDRNPIPWIALIQFLHGTGEQQQAQEAIVRAAAKIPKDQAPLALAQCYEGTGKLARAKQKYEEALGASPASPHVALSVAGFYLRTKQSEPARKLLNGMIAGKIASSPADVIWARRCLALLLASQGDYRSFQKAVGMIRENLESDASSAQDRRVLAGLLAQSPDRREHREAIGVLEDLLKTQRSPDPQDQFILARLYQDENIWPKASNLMLQLLSLHGDQPRYVRAYVAALLQRDDFEGTELWLSRLERIAPNTRHTAELRAELSFRQKRYDKAIETLRAFIENRRAQPADRAARVRAAASQLEQFTDQLADSGRTDPATRLDAETERLLRLLAVERPDQRTRLAVFLGKKGQIEESLKIVEEAWRQSDPASLAQACVVLLKAESASRLQQERAEKIVQDAMDEFGRPRALLLSMADVRTLQGQNRQAEALYRELIEKYDPNAVAMNNLAILLALQGVKLDEALKLINRALEIAGPMASMLDSRSTVYVALGQYDKALADLELAIADAETPIRLFHRAQACQRAGRSREAIQAIKKARALGLKPDMLQPLERPAYEKLKGLLK